MPLRGLVTGLTELGSKAYVACRSDLSHQQHRNAFDMGDREGVDIYR